VPPCPNYSRHRAPEGRVQARMLGIFACHSRQSIKGVCRMNPETQPSESPYCVRIETETGQSATVPIAVLTPKQLEIFLQTEFKRLAQEAGVRGARIHVERAVAADYEQVLREVTACLSSAKKRAA
jgi:hypothetical protein